MKKNEVIEIARMAGAHDDEERFEFHQYKYLERFANEVERRTLERCLEAISPNGTPMEITTAIRALKENT